MIDTKMNRRLASERVVEGLSVVVKGCLLLPEFVGPLSFTYWTGYPKQPRSIWWWCGLLELARHGRLSQRSNPPHSPLSHTICLLCAVG